MILVTDNLNLFSFLVTFFKYTVSVMTYWKWLFDVWEETSEEKFEANNRDMSSKLERAKIKQVN